MVVPCALAVFVGERIKHSVIAAKTQGTSTSGGERRLTAKEKASREAEAIREEVRALRTEMKVLKMKTEIQTATKTADVMTRDGGHAASRATAVQSSVTSPR